MADVRDASRHPPRHGTQRSRTPQRKSKTLSKSKTSSSRNCRQSSPSTRDDIQCQSCVTSLPADVWTQLLPFLTWRDTNALLSVCCEWRKVVLNAKKLHPEWRSTVLGPSSNGSKSLELLRTNHLNWSDTRFAPDLVLLLATSKDSTPWQSGGYWEEAIAVIEEEKLLPSTCKIITLFTMNAVLGASEEESETSFSAVTLSISVAHLPETKVEMAEFDRKDLRRYHRGADLDYPFTVLEDGDLPSFLLFGVNDQSASQVVPAIEQWHPGAAVIGAVSPLIDRCVPLAVYRGDVAPIQRQERQQQRKKGVKKQVVQLLSRRRRRPRNPVTFPSTLLLRLDGKIGLQTFSSSGYYPVTRVIRCERVTVAVEVTQVVTYDLVSMSHEASDEVEQHRIMDLLEPAERLAIEQEGRSLNIFSCPESAPLEHLYEHCNAHQSTLYTPDSAQIDRLEFVFWLQGGLMSLPGLCWQQGSYGLLASHQPKRASPALLKALQSTKRDATMFGAFMIAGALNEGEDAVHATEISQLCTDIFEKLQLGGCIVNSSIGPVAFPGGLQPAHRRYTQVQTHTTCGVILYVKE